jgi:serine/threonine protein kinase
MPTLTDNLAALNHANIATIYGLEQAESVTCLVMELVSGETLAERVKAGPYGIEEALKIAVQIAESGRSMTQLAQVLMNRIIGI